MKKITLFLALGFASVVAFAQNNTSNVSSIGEENKANVVQTGLENAAIVAQDGNNNEALIKEGNLTGATSKYADGKIDQTGNLNYAELNITGEYHNIPGHGITQVQVGAGLVGNRAIVNQRGTNNDMDVLQIGTNNLTTATQNGGQKNQFYVEQDGISNTATIQQNGNWNSGVRFVGGTNPEAVNWNTLYQEGKFNIGDIVQGTLNKFTLYQIGNENSVKAEQGAGTIMEIRQVGDNNVVGGLVNSMPTDLLILDNAASLDALQKGDNNKLNVTTAGDLVTIQDNSGTAGVGNKIRYSQALDGYVELTQLGDENLIKLKNNSNMGIDMDVNVYQKGNKNTLAKFDGGVVVGSAEFAGEHLDIGQLGNENSIHLISTGTMNVVDVMQNGNGNWASVIQN